MRQVGPRRSDLEWPIRAQARHHQSASPRATAAAVHCSNKCRQKYVPYSGLTAWAATLISAARAACTRQPGRPCLPHPYLYSCLELVSFFALHCEFQMPLLLLPLLPFLWPRAKANATKDFWPNLIVSNAANFQCSSYQFSVLWPRNTAQSKTLPRLIYIN